jgi:hypothetical protein
LGFMKVFEDTADSTVKKYCCILMFFILTTDVYVENMRRASWVEALQKKSIYLEEKLKRSRRSSNDRRKFLWLQRSMRKFLCLVLPQEE